MTEPTSSKSDARSPLDQQPYFASSPTLTGSASGWATPHSARRRRPVTVATPTAHRARHHPGNRARRTPRLLLGLRRPEMQHLPPNSTSRRDRPRPIPSGTLITLRHSGLSPNAATTRWAGGTISPRSRTPRRRSRRRRSGRRDVPGRMGRARSRETRRPARAVLGRERVFRDAMGYAEGRDDLTDYIGAAQTLRAQHRLRARRAAAARARPHQLPLANGRAGRVRDDDGKQRRRAVARRSVSEYDRLLGSANAGARLRANAGAFASLHGGANHRFEQQAVLRE